MRRSWLALLGWLPALLTLALGAEGLPEGEHRQHAGDRTQDCGQLPDHTGPDGRRLGPTSPQLAIVGRWREVGRDATLDMRQDGTFTAVDNEGLAVAGRYVLTTPCSLQFEVQLDGTTQYLVPLDFSVRGDELTLTAPDAQGVERYRRQR